MHRVRDLDAANHTVTVEAGCILADVQNRAAEADRYFPLSLAAEGSCMIGGNLSTNAGGTNVLKYGNARDRSEEHASELQSLMRNSYAVFCLKNKKTYTTNKQI